MAGSTACRLCGRTFDPYGSTHHSYCKACTARSDRAVAKTHRLDCKECGKKFTARIRTVRYCSDECRVDGKRRFLREYMRRYMADPGNHGRMLARVRAAKSARRAREGRGGRQGQRQRRQGPQPRAAEKAKSHTCGLCGIKFATYGGARHTYCKRCTAKADREVSKARRNECKVCGKAFTAVPHSVLYCSDECRASGKRRTVLERRRRLAADPERHAATLARQRAWYAAHKDEAGTEQAAAARQTR